MFLQYHLSPLGLFKIVATADAVTEVTLIVSPKEKESPNALTRAMSAWLTAYFGGSRAPCPLPLCPKGTPFRQAVWDALRQIPYGRTVRYGEIAAQLHRPGASRAVGSAVGKNPILIAIPCHRVVSSSGVGGFSALGGVETKKKLMELEGTFLSLL